MQGTVLHCCEISYTSSLYILLNTLDLECLIYIKDKKCLRALNHSLDFGICSFSLSIVFPKPPINYLVKEGDNKSFTETYCF